jgi:tetratricopeptide (TPR) repeat protein
MSAAAPVPMAQSPIIQRSTARHESPRGARVGDAVAKELAALLKQGRFAEVERHARAIIERYPANGPAWKALAVALQMQSKAALPAARTAADLLPADAEAQYNLGLSLLDAGQPGAALDRFRSALTLAPGHVQAYVAQGSTLQGLGRVSEAADCYRRALAIKPDMLEVWISLAGLLRGLRLPEQAVECYRRALQLRPDLAAGHAGLGHALADLGRLADAAASLQRALEINPRLAEVHNSLGHVLRALGRPLEALESCRRALQIDPGMAAAHSNSGNALVTLGRLEEAEASYRRALELAPERAEIYSNLSKALLDMGRVGESVASSRRALQLNPTLAEAHENLANALINVNIEQAVAHYRIALESHPDDAELNSNLGIALRLMGQTAEAEAHCRKAMELAPVYAPAVAALAEAQADRGEFEQARALFEQALVLDPELAEAWVGLSRLRKFTRGDSAWLEQAERLANRSGRPKEVIALRYAIGKYYDDVGDYEQAFGSYQRANELARRHATAYDREQMTRRIDALIDRYAQVSTAHDEAIASSRTVLIVGMPRSGTSLAEQILASHPAVFGAGELTYWHSAGASLPAGAALDNSSIRRLGTGYERLLAEMAPGALCVVDKMPTNFLELGLICSVLPGVRIIHIQRDPIDTCLSIYFQDFRATLAYANDLDDLAHFYREYHRLMAHWRQVLSPKVLLDVPYEGLVEHQEDWTRRMLDFMGLPWDARCLDFHQTQRSVVTASKWQVRQRINKSSIARWRHYESHIAPLLALSALNEGPASPRT